MQPRSTATISAPHPLAIAMLGRYRSNTIRSVSRPSLLDYLPATRPPYSFTAFMCTEHIAACPVCGKDYLVYVAFCRDYHPPRRRCPGGLNIERGDMQEGRCPSPVCPYSRNGGCVVS
ncbi:hypothetical protein GGR56DRAFT_439295 [Xylariaceae sp. FL0804]|nr:hypothetical protein GGR56DRAFT_439295 [Xylariaceae sp. FL0804]